MTKSNRMRGSGLLFLIPVALLLSSSAAAAGKQAGKQAKERLAKKACLSGEPAKGVSILAELYVDTNDITYLFNQGRCYEQNRHYEDAVGRFREYLMKGGKNLSEEDRALAKAHIEACEPYLPKPEPRPPLAPEPVAAPPIVVPPPPPAEIASEVPPVVVAVEPKPRDAKAGAGLRIAGIVVGSLGVAGLATGVILNLKANSMATDLEKPSNFDREIDSSRKSYKTVALIGYGVGAACLAGGTLMYILGWRSGHRSKSDLALVPTFAPGSAGALLTGAF